MGGERREGEGLVRNFTPSLLPLTRTHISKRTPKKPTQIRIKKKFPALPKKPRQLYVKVSVTFCPVLNCKQCLRKDIEISVKNVLLFFVVWKAS